MGGVWRLVFFHIQRHENGVVVACVGLDATIGERVDVGGMEHMIDAEIGERAVVGGTEPPTLLGIGIDHVAGHHLIKIGSGSIVEVAQHHERLHLAVHKRREVVLPLMLVAKDRAAELAVDALGLGGIGGTVHDGFQPLLVLTVELIRVEMDTAYIERMPVVVDLDAEMSGIGVGGDIREGELRENDEAVAVGTVAMDVTHRLQAVGSIHTMGREILLQTENVGRVFAHQLQEHSGTGVGRETIVGAVEPMDIERHHLHNIRIGALLGRGGIGGAAQLEKERQEGVAHEDGHQRDQELPTSHKEPDQNKENVDQQKDEVVQSALGGHIYANFKEAKEIEFDMYRSTVHQWERDQYMKMY